MKFGKIYTEYKEGHVFIDSKNVLISWSIGDFQGIDHQYNYRIKVGNSIENLQTDQLIYDTGRQVGELSNTLRIKNLKLESYTTYYYLIEVVSKKGKEIRSKVHSFETGALNQEDWHGKWINQGENYIEGWSPLFRKIFKLSEKQIKKARLYICGLGYYEGYINGKKIGDQILDPAQTDYEQRCMYNIHDITEMLDHRDNCIGVMLGDGFFNQTRVWEGIGSYGQPCLNFQILIHYEDGETEWIFSDEKVKRQHGPITLNNIYLGENYDARLEKKGWNEFNFEDKEWQEAKIDQSEKGNFCYQYIEPIKKKEEVLPISVTYPQDGIAIFDMGMNIGGIIRLKAIGKSSSQFTMRFAEQLTPQGLLDFNSCGAEATKGIQTCMYTKMSDEVEYYEMKFVYHGFRYIEVVGLQETPTLDTIIGYKLYNDVDNEGMFESSNILLNKIHDAAINTITSNIQSIPSDCPVREKCGWVGDALIVADSMMYNFNSYNFLKKYIEDIWTSYKCNGHFTMIAPGKRTCGEAVPAWGSAIAVIPWLHYKFYGDKEILEVNYAPINIWIDSLKEKAKAHLIHDGLDDWWVVGARQDTKLKKGIISTFFYYISVKLFNNIAKLLGKDEQEEYIVLEQQIKETFNKNYLDKTSMDYGTQTANALALHWGLVPKEKEQDIADTLANQVLSSGKHLTSGHIGVRYVLSMLSKYGYKQLAYEVMTQKDYPSFGYMIEKGATTIWERWEDWDNWSPITRQGSMSHPFKCGYEIWFYEELLGIKPISAGFETVMISPYLPQGEEYIQGYYNSTRGKIEVKLSRDKDSEKLEVSIPPHTKAIIVVEADQEAIKVKSNNNIVFNKAAGRKTEYTCMQGKYVFEY